MTENGSEFLPFESPEQENIRLREENARLRRLLAAHSISIPQLAPEKPPATKAVEPAPPVDKEERARRPNRAVSKLVSRKRGCVRTAIVDECHHISAFTFEQVMRQVKAKYVVGLTATPTRKDGHHPIIYMQCGPVRFSMSTRTMTETTPFEHKVTPRYTDFRMSPELTEITIQDIYAALVDDVSRNEMIANDIVRAVESGRCPLLLTWRTEHLQFFASRLAGVARQVFVLKGGMGKKQRRETAAAWHPCRRTNRG